MVVKAEGPRQRPRMVVDRQTTNGRKQSAQVAKWVVCGGGLRARAVMHELLELGRLGGVVVDVINRGSSNRSTRYPEIACDYESLITNFARENAVPLFTNGILSRDFVPWAQDLGLDGGILVSHGEKVTWERMEFFRRWWINFHTYPWQLPWPSTVYDGCTPMEQMYLTGRSMAQVVAHVIDQDFDRGFEIARSRRFMLAPFIPPRTRAQALPLSEALGRAIRENQRTGALRSKELARELIPQLDGPILEGEPADFKILQSALGRGVKAPKLQ